MFQAGCQHRGWIECPDEHTCEFYNPRPVGREFLFIARIRSLAQRIALAELRNLIPKLELVKDLLHIRRELVEVGIEVRHELLLAASRPEIAEREL